MNTAEYLVKKLEELGINDFFGLPGDYNFEILYAIEENQNVNWHGCTNELNAGYAADGYAREKGYGALVTTYGVGELSAINAIIIASNVWLLFERRSDKKKRTFKPKKKNSKFKELDEHVFIGIND